MVKVKPLVWDLRPAGLFVAEGVGLVYAISTRPRVTFTKWPPGTSPHFETVLEAKAEAQIDYERRIRSALIMEE